MVLKYSEILLNIWSFEFCFSGCTFFFNKGISPYNDLISYSTLSPYKQNSARLIHVMMRIFCIEVPLYICPTDVLSRSVRFLEEWIRIFYFSAGVLFSCGWCFHRGEAMYISLIDFQWTSTETKSFQEFNNSKFNHNYVYQLWKYICHTSTKMC